MNWLPFNFIFQCSYHIEINQRSSQKVQGGEIEENDGKYKIVVRVKLKMVGERIDTEDNQVGREEESILVCFSAVKENNAGKDNKKAKSVYNHFNEIS